MTQNLTDIPDAKIFIHNGVEPISKIDATQKGKGSIPQPAGQHGTLKKPSLRRLTIKQRKFVKAYVRLDGNGTRAALEAYGTTDYATANAIARETLQKPSVQDAIEQALEKKEITIESAIEPIKAGLSANKKVFRNNNESGEVEEISSEPDHNVRLKASGMALKLLGADNGDSPVSPINFNIFQKGSAQQNAYVKTTPQKVSE